MASFVLVHGAWGGSLSYREIARQLRAKGHDVYAPSLTGLGDRSHLLDPRIDLSLHIKDVTTVFDYEDLKDVILVGYSYGGMVITGVSALRADRIRSLVYLDAFLPDNGQSLFDLQPKEDREHTINMQRDTPGLVPFSFGPPSSRGAPPPVPPSLGPHPLLTLVEPVTLDGWERQIRHRTYILATSPPVSFQRFYDKVQAMNDPSWKLATIATGHVVMADDPDGLTALLLAELDR